MKIIDIELVTINVPLITPFKTALRTVYAVEDIVVKVKTDSGHVGFGEAAPTAVITGETLGSITNAIEQYIKPSIIGMEIIELEEIMKRIHGCILKNTSAKAAVDIAIYDLYAQYYQAPLYQLLGAYRNELQTDITISVNSIDEMVKDSILAVEKGFSILKIKVGKDSQKDIDRIKAIRRAVGENIRLRVDANQGWSSKEAIRIIRALEDSNLNIELVEQPVHYTDFEGLKEVTRNTYTKILADESVFSPKEAIQVIQERAADFINIKLMKTGGIYQALKICNIAEIYNVECMIGCMLESKISVSAAAHLAAAKRMITMVDLDGPALCQYDPIYGGPIFNGGSIQMIDRQGLGFHENLVGGII
ncbi:MAG: dipeptide epimerase [Bacillaceae bacterium]